MTHMRNTKIAMTALFVIVIALACHASIELSKRDATIADLTDRLDAVEAQSAGLLLNDIWTRDRIIEGADGYTALNKKLDGNMVTLEMLLRRARS